VAILARELLVEPKYFEVVLPRLPVPVERDIKQKLSTIPIIHPRPAGERPSGSGKRERSPPRRKDDSDTRRKRSRSRSPGDSSASKRTKYEDRSDEEEKFEVTGPSVEEKFAASAPKKVMTKEEVMRLKATYGNASSKPGDTETKQVRTKRLFILNCERGD